LAKKQKQKPAEKAAPKTTRVDLNEQDIDNCKVIMPTLDSAIERVTITAAVRKALKFYATLAAAKKSQPVSAQKVVAPSAAAAPTQPQRPAPIPEGRNEPATY